MSWRRAVAAALLVALATAAPGAASKHPTNVHWERYLPALPTPAERQPGSIPFCRRPALRCVDTQALRMRRLQRQLGCDHRAVFATTYLELTLALRRVLDERPHFFRYPRYLFTEDALFANVYFTTVSDWRRGRRVPQAWRVAFETARDGEVNAAQDMLLGINAHVQNDMPFVLAALGLRTPGGDSRKIDHDRMNEVLDRSYEHVVAAVADRYDAFVRTTNSSASPLDDVAGLELVKEWRERVWRNAERLLLARGEAERRRVAAEIESTAGGWARGIAALGQRGHRAVRDAYCRERLGATSAARPPRSV